MTGRRQKTSWERWPEMPRAGVEAVIVGMERKVWIEGIVKR